MVRKVGCRLTVVEDKKALKIMWARFTKPGPLSLSTEVLV